MIENVDSILDKKCMRRGQELNNDGSHSYNIIGDIAATFKGLNLGCERS